MNDNLEYQIQEALDERAKIEKLLAEREAKDRRIISIYCAKNTPEDMFHSLDLLEKFNGMPDYDKNVINRFRSSYPSELTIKLIKQFSDIKDIYSRYLESGGGK